MGTGTWAQQVSQDEAMQRAIQFFAKPSSNGMKKALRKAPRMKAAEVNDAYYIFNDEANGGFVIVSGEERTPDILGYSNGGWFDAAKVPANMRAWLDGYKAQIKAAAASTMPTATSETYVSRTPIAPLLRTEWNQLSPYNLLCPMDNGKQCVTGCVATAMAQVMNYWQHPAQTTATIPNRVAERLNFTHPDIAAGTAIDWANMPRTQLDATTDAQQQAVSELMLYCGMAVQMNYGANSSAAYVSNIAPALINYFGYDPGCRLLFRSNYEDWLYIIYNELRQGRPILYYGSSSSSAHEFVCDGYASEDYYHIDWGWGGAYNGFFRLQVMNPEGRGTGGGSSSDGYAQLQNVILGCVPAGHADPQAPIACRSIAMNQTSFTRNSTGNFSGITITPELFVTTHCSSIDYALALWQNGQQLSLLSTATTSDRVGESFKNDISVSLGEDLADGEYQITPVCRRTGESTWQRCLDAISSSLTATISGETLTLSPMEDTSTPIEAKLVCTATPIITGSYHYTDNFSASFTVRNEGDDYAGPLYIINSTTQDVLAEQVVSIAAGETKTIVMENVVTCSMNSDNSNNTFHLGSYIGNVYVSSSEFALSPYPHLKVTYTLPSTAEREGDYLWIYDKSLTATARIEYPQPTGYAPTVNGQVTIWLGWCPQIAPFATMNANISLKPGEAVEIPVYFDESTLSAHYNALMALRTYPVESSTRFFIDETWDDVTWFFINGGPKAPELVKYTVNITPNGAGSTNGKSSSSIIAGSELSITAQPFWRYEGNTYYWNEELYKMYSDAHIDYFFDHWTNNGVVVSEDNTLTFNITENSNLVAHFKPVPKLTCLETPLVEGTLEKGSMNTFKTVVWNESDEDYEGDITLKYYTGGYTAEASATTHVSIKAGETQAISLPLKNIATQSYKESIITWLTFSHPKLAEKERMISGGHIEIDPDPGINATFTVLNADAEHVIPTDSIIVNVMVERQPNCPAYKGPITIELLRDEDTGCGEDVIDVDLTEQSSVEKVLVFNSENSFITSFLGHALHFGLPATYDRKPYYAATTVGADTNYKLTTNWGLRGAYFLVSSSAEAGKVGLRSTRDLANDNDFYGTGMTVRAHATPAEGYYFRSWTDEAGNIVSRDALYIFKASFATAGEIKTLKANFEKGTAPAKHTVKVKAEPFQQGSVSGDGVFYAGENAVLKATAAKGYEFICWQAEDGTQLSTDATYTVTVSQDATYTAVFTIYENLVITAENKSMVYGGEVPELTYKVTGTGTLKGEPSLITSVRSTTKPGTYDIIVQKGTTNNRRLTLKNGNLTVKKAELTGHVEDATMHLGEELPTFVFTLEGFVGNDTMESTFTTLPRCYVSGGTPKEVGTYTIKMTRGSSDYYNVTTGEGTLTVLMADAIQDILSENAPADIYTLSGQKIRAKAKDLHNLPAGAYIIGGKKVVIGR